MSRERFLRLLDRGGYLANHIHEAPVWFVPCLEGGTPTRTSGSSIYPAVQNMLLAARALGLGARRTGAIQLAAGGSRFPTQPRRCAVVRLMAANGRSDSCEGRGSLRMGL